MAIGDGRVRGRAQDVDRHVGARMRERRIMLGLTQENMAGMLGVSYQQAHKYERGINRIAAGRLWQIAQALGVDVDYFYEGMKSGSGEAFLATTQQRLLLDLAQNFMGLRNAKHREAVATLVRTLAKDDWDK